MTIEWLAGNRIRGTTAERPSASLQSPSVGGWKLLDRTTLGSAGDNIDITSLPDKRYYMYLLDRDTSGSTSARMTFNGDDASSNQNYSTRYASNGTEYNAPSQDYVSQHTAATEDSFTCGYIANKSDKEKLIISWVVGNAAPPSRYEQFWKWDNTSNAINRMDIYNHLSGDFASGSELVVLGWDPDDTHTDNFWEELASTNATSNQLSTGTFTAKKYLWIQYYLKPTGGTVNGKIHLNDETSGSNYSDRINYLNGEDTHNNFSHWFGHATWEGSTTTSEDMFCNMFILNNTSNPKLAIQHLTNSTGGASSEPNQTEWVNRWNNTTEQITKIDIDRNLGTGTYDSTSFIKVWGAD